MFVYYVQALLQGKKKIKVIWGKISNHFINWNVSVQIM